MEEWLKEMWPRYVPGFQVVNTSPSNGKKYRLDPSLGSYGLTCLVAKTPNHKTATI